MPDALRSRVFDRMERKFDIMEELGANLLLVARTLSPSSLGDRSASSTTFGSWVNERQREVCASDMKRWLGDGTFTITATHGHRARRGASAIGSSSTASIRSRGRYRSTSLPRHRPEQDLPRATRRCAARCRWTYLSWSRHFRNLPGQGDLAVVDYVAALLARGYDGSCRWKSSTIVFAPARRQRRRSTAFARCDFPHRSGASQSASAATDGHAAARACRGVEFIEFAANEEEVEPLSRMFAALGFTKAGHHRSKDVTRWQQNGINFVINSEPDSFARAYDSVHGASVCAIGLSVDDVDAAMRRAQALQMSSFAQPIGPGELHIPSIRGVGGSLIYFMERDDERQVWDHEFVPTADAAGVEGAGLTRVDCVDQTMQYEEMLSWLLYYVSLFDMDKSPQAEVADPSGLCSSKHWIARSILPRHAQWIGGQRDTVCALPAGVHGCGCTARCPCDRRHLRDGSAAT